MRSATDFMFDTLAKRGGFVWLYTQAHEPYGELKARPSMIWVQPPGTPTVGLLLLEAYSATGEDYYLAQAKKVADALAAGQRPSGGWHYFIDFEPEGLQAYYDTFFSKCWGWREYLKNRPNCTFDDYTTTEPTRFFLRLAAITRDAAHERVRDRALAHILRAQYANGGWPQRYPPEQEAYDYTQACTFNDDVIYDCILVLMEASEVLADERCRLAARRGMDFYVDAQLPAPQAGWPQQCREDYTPAWGRPFEIATVCAMQTHSNILQLFDFYSMTGDAKYLAPAPKALDWLAASVIPDAEGFTHTCFYEMGTNRPIYIKQTGTSIEDVDYAPTFEEAGCYPYAHRMTVPAAALRAEYGRLRALAPAEAQAAYRAARAAAPLPEFVRGHYLALALGHTAQTDAGIAAILAAQLENGGWLDAVSLLDPFSPFTAPRRDLDAYTTGGYLARMYRMINFLNQPKE